LELLRLLIATGRLHFATRSELVENKNFCLGLFRNVISSARTVACQNGRIIDVSDAASMLEVHAASKLSL
jgi:hypothetical protein